LIIFSLKVHLVKFYSGVVTKKINPPPCRKMKKEKLTSLVGLESQLVIDAK
jgi:hypothetical protein